MKKSRRNANTVDELCPCGTGHAYAVCCGRWHHGPERLCAPTAEALMRSRYSAFVREEAAYLLDTWHADTRPASLAFDGPGLTWLGLEIKHHAMPSPTTATVHFVARSKLGGRAHRLEEISRFVFEHGQWWYVKGDFFP